MLGLFGRRQGFSMADGELEIFQILRECNECNECNERNEQALHHGFQSRDSRTDEMQIDRSGRG